MANDVAKNAAGAADAPLLALIIDDDPSIRQFITAAIAGPGMKVASYAAAKEALASVDACHPAIIFLDVALSGSDAIDVFRGLSERGYGGVVQLMSGGRPALLHAIARIGVRHRMRLASPLNKPFSQEAIVQVIKDLRSPGLFPVPDRAAIAAAIAMNE